MRVGRMSAVSSIGAICVGISLFLLPMDLQTSLTNSLESITSPSTLHYTNHFQTQELLPDFKTSTYKCSEKKGTNSSINPVLFRSQSGEDKRLLSLFPNLCGGRYIEFGALDGKKFSNSYVFNFGFEWKGVLIEIGPLNYQQLIVNRPNELAVVNAGVCKERQTLHYVEQGPVGGIWEFMTPEFKNTWFQGKTIDIATEFLCHPLQEILDIHLAQSSSIAPTAIEAATKPDSASASATAAAPPITQVHQYFDFLSVDVEGAEIQAIESIDFSRTGFGVILCEASDLEGKNVALQTFLISKGYRYLYQWQRSDWFVNEQFYKIYEGLI